MMQNRQRTKRETGTIEVYAPGKGREVEKMSTILPDVTYGT